MPTFSNSIAQAQQSLARVRGNDKSRLKGKTHRKVSGAATKKATVSGFLEF
jgi:hypothetical protein